MILLDLDVEGVPLSVSICPGMVKGDEPEVGRLFEGAFWLCGRLHQPRESRGLLGRTIDRLRG